jgi:hypothetical protein
MLPAGDVLDDGDDIVVDEQLRGIAYVFVYLILSICYVHLFVSWYAWTH